MSSLFDHIESLLRWPLAFALVIIVYFVIKNNRETIKELIKLIKHLKK